MKEKTVKLFQKSIKLCVRKLKKMELQNDSRLNETFAKNVRKKN